MANDFKGAYSNFIHSIYHSINSGNVQNITRALKIIKEQVLPYIVKSDIELIKKDSTLDIEDMFKHIATIDTKRVFALSVTEIREIISRLPDTQLTR